VTDKALISVRQVPRTESATIIERNIVKSLNLVVDYLLPQGTLVIGNRDDFSKIEQRQFRVKIFPDTNILQIGSYRIDIEGDFPQIPEQLGVPKALEEMWIHYLLQFKAPPISEWIDIVKEHGVDVVEPVSAYSLFVVGNKDRVFSLNDLDFITWIGIFQPAYRISKELLTMEGSIRYVRISIYPANEINSVKEKCISINASIVKESKFSGRFKNEHATLIVEMSSEGLVTIARLPAVRRLEFASPQAGIDGEREAQIVAMNLDPSNIKPIPGYQSWLKKIELEGNGVTVAICDTGVDVNSENNTSGHQDLRGRQLAFIDYTNSTFLTDTDGHGTHVAGIILSNASTGQKEGNSENDFFWGQGIAPKSNYVTQNAVLGPFPPSDFGILTGDAVRNGAQVMNNSWWDGGPPGSGYTENSKRFDQLIRDPDPTSPNLEYLVVVFSAGNKGPKDNTITPPKEAKNPIVVGSSENFRPTVSYPNADIKGIRTDSSRGPSLPGRILPHVVAPGSRVSSTWSSTGSVIHGPTIPGTGSTDPTNPERIFNGYQFFSGSSHAAPHVSGCCALIIEWWRKKFGKNPSPAMIKALLINGAEDLVGGPSGRIDSVGNSIPLTNIPNNEQGWGRVSLKNILFDFPDSNRGPKVLFDQTSAFTNNGEEFSIDVSIVATDRPLRVTLTWTDAPGASGVNPPLVNDLDLEIIDLNTDKIFKGNMFSSGFSTPGGNFDTYDNVECVYVENPTPRYRVNVIAANIRLNALPPFDNTRWQDFALVVDNAKLLSI
jgi:subtilisin family serine protease